MSKKSRRPRPVKAPGHRLISVGQRWTGVLSGKTSYFLCECKYGEQGAPNDGEARQNHQAHVQEVLAASIQ